MCLCVQLDKSNLCVLLRQLVTARKGDASVLDWPVPFVSQSRLSLDGSSIIITSLLFYYYLLLFRIIIIGVVIDYL